MQIKIKNILTAKNSIQDLRFYIQTGFALICIWIGIEFYIFIEALQNPGIQENLYRPPGVEAFLPISSLMNLLYWIYSGIIHPYHPAGLFILIAIIGVSLVFGKSFCSWICPVGFLSELVGDFGDKISEKLFRKRIKLPKLIDYPLRSLKYLLLLFFVNVIFWEMNELALKYFLDGDYNLMSDIKMYFFFADISPFAFKVISVLFFLSVMFRNFWCRYLCPYGALLGLIGFFSPTKIKRNEASCIDCSECSKVCPSFIKVDKIKTVISDECVSCYKCVDSCPVDNTLNIKIIASDYKFNKKLIPVILLTIYAAVLGVGMLTGNWNNNVEMNRYRELIKEVNSLGHPTNSEDIKNLQQ